MQLYLTLSLRSISDGHIFIYTFDIMNGKQFD